MTVTRLDVRRLLRSLSDPVALKHDSLAARLVGGGKLDPAAMRERADRVGAVLRASLASMCSHTLADRTNGRLRRAARIIERCDLGGRSHDAVAAEIGLARRQFYRDRSYALDALAIELDDLIRAKTPNVERTIDAARLAFETAEALVGIGKYDDAEGVLGRIEASARNRDDRLLAAARLVEAACESGERTRTQRALQRAHAADAGDARAHPLARARFGLALVLADDALAVAGRGEDRRLALLEELRSLAVSSDERWETLTLGLSHRATAAHTKGDFATALASLHEAEAVLRRCERAPSTLTALLPNLLGVTLMMLPQSLDAASEQHQRAIALARPRGLMRIVVAATLNDCAIDLWQGRARNVCDRAIATLQTARAVSSREELGRMSILVSKIALGAGRLGDALALLEEVQVSGDEFPRLAPRAMLAKAQVLLHAGEFERASATARDALRATHSSGESSLTGTALLLDAEALAGTRHPARARKALDQALAVLRKTGSAHVLGRARELAQRLNAL